MYPLGSKEHIRNLKNELKKLIQNYEDDYPDAVNELRNRDFIIEQSNIPNELLEAISIKEELLELERTVGTLLESIV